MISNGSTVDTPLESLITIVLYYVLERQLVERRHLLEDKGVVPGLVLVEGPVMRHWLCERKSSICSASGAAGLFLLNLRKTIRIRRTFLL